MPVSLSTFRTLVESCVLRKVTSNQASIELNLLYFEPGAPRNPHYQFGKTLQDQSLPL